MALIIPGESASTLSTPTENKQITDRLATVKDTFSNRTTVTPERYSELYGTLMGFASGTPITVEYYNKMLTMVNKQTDDIDMSTVRHSAQLSYHLIHNFEIKLDGQFEVTYNEETTETEVMGAGLTYPGFKPKLGDVFLYQLAGQELGTFSVSAVERLSIQQGTYHRIKFKLYNYTSNDDLVKLNTAVNEESYFSKEKFLRGDVSLLESREYLDLMDLKKYRDILIKYYIQKFYSNEHNTLMRLDGVYDPYIVEYFNLRVSYSDSRKRPTQLYPILPNYDSSFWYLLNNDTHIDVTLLKKDYYVLYLGYKTWAAGINGLTNRQMLILDTHTSSNFTFTEIDYAELELQSDYVFTDKFYLGVLADMSAFEQLVYTAITTNTVNITTLINTYVKTFSSLTDEQQFYYICIYIYLIDLAMSNIG